jgi:hypothetical protein
MRRAAPALAIGFRFFMLRSRANLEKQFIYQTQAPFSPMSNGASRTSLPYTDFTPNDVQYWTDPK